jgi:iron complex outermembrane receptor protein
LPTVANGAFNVSKENNSVQTYQGLLHYDDAFHQGDLRLSTYGGFIYRLSTSETLGTGTIGGLNFPGWYSLNNEAGIPSSGNLYQLRSYTRGSDVVYSGVASATLSWKQELYLELQARDDWNSTLPPQANRYFYPGGSITWNYTDRFKVRNMNSGQVRFSWANVGSGAPRYFANNQYSLGYVTGTGAQAVSVGTPANILPGALGPEQKREVELGINNSFFKNNRLTFDMDVYINNRYKEIISLPISQASSSTGLLINVGNVRDRGFEFSVTGTPLLTRDFRWDITLNGAMQASKVLKLYGDLTQYVKETLINGNAAAVNANLGQPAGEIMVEDYNRDDKGNKTVDANGLYSLNADPTKMISAGNVDPKVYGGVLSDMHYKNFSLRIALDYKYGGTIFSYTNMRLTGVGQLESTLQYRDQQHGGMAYYIDGSGNKVATQHNATAPPASVDGHVYHDGVILPGVKMNASGEYVKNDIITSATAYYETYANDLATAFPPDRFYKNDYIMLRELSVNYAVPHKMAERMHLQGLSFTLAGRNLFYLYKSIPNIDAESALSADGYVENTVFPGQQTFSFGLNVSF